MKKKIIYIIAVALFTVLNAFYIHSAQITTEKLDESIKKDFTTRLFKIYKHLHQNPELSGSEKETSKILAKEMRELGYDVTENIGGYGIAAILKNGDGPTVLIRTDMDALPVKEKTGLSYASKATVIDKDGKKTGVMHACGHDIHMTVWLGVAKQLIRLRDKWSGTVIMIGQPAEETGEGSKAMLVDGLYERFGKPDYNFALHVAPDLETGKIRYVSGYAMANVDSVDIIVKGIGGHGAYPHITKDPIVLASRIVIALQTIISREISPLEPAVITVGSFHGGTKYNVIPSSAKLELTVRSFSDETREYLLNAIKRTAKYTALSYDIKKENLPIVKLREGFTPALYNDPQLVSETVSVLKNYLGEDALVQGEPSMGGEDFSRYGKYKGYIPSFLFWLGSVDKNKIERAKEEGVKLPGLHSPYFAPKPKPTIITGIKAMTLSVLSKLSHQDMNKN
ncbi:MAG: amidohydrolase [Deferribacterota bacterium]|nr:amidohydrolase [Deferribacterota bacterium]